MAKRFLDQLTKVPENELPKDSSCMICRHEYSSDSVDFAVRLPCKHHVGFECIKTWLSPDRDTKNSCPMCRHVFFAVVDEEEEEQYHREIIGRVGRPPQGNGDNSTSHPTWYGWFVEAAAEQYQESLTQARAYFARHPGGEIKGFHIERLATAYRTLPIRDMLLYLKFSHEGSFPPVEGLISGALNAEQLEALFQELVRREAFDIELHPFPNYHGLTDRQMWLLHREEGESYTTWEGGYWSLLLG